ncbi:MAG: hypothetical protein KBC47_04230 [Candidatus Peribacteraceae bacterium]|nr:hypothetical protein [Candidatus Peribacteraceae bacterium]
MASKIGCGSVVAFILILLILLILGSNEAAGYYFSRCHNVHLLDCLMGGLDEPEEEEGSVTATGVYSYKGYDVNISANIPLGGGNVTGTVSGTCDGIVKGTFNGQDGGAITGSMHGACSPFFVNVPASADFTGTVRKGSKTIPFNFSGRGAGISHEGSMTLTY